MKVRIGIILVLLGAVLGAVTMCYVHRRCADDPHVVTMRDTILSVRTDTITIDRPVPVRTMLTDTIYIAVTDTITIRDSIYLRVPHTTKIYADSTYSAQVSGYRPSLDWIEIYPQTVVMTIKERQKGSRWNLGLYGGYGITINNSGVQAGVQVGAGVTYNLF